MTIATYNAASVRARLPRLLEWLEQHEPDVLALQETKVEDDKFPDEPFRDLGYELALHGQKSWNGVALLARAPIEDVRRGFGDPTMPEDARIIRGRVGGIEIVNTYLPNGNAVGSEKWEYKLRWMERFADLIGSYPAGTPLVWLGDVNVAPEPRDVYDSPRFLYGVGHHPEEFARLAEIVRRGDLTDAFRHLHPEAVEYSFFDFVIPKAAERNLGWRIDHIYLSPSVLPRLSSCHIDADARRVEKPSDHTFVVAELAS